MGGWVQVALGKNGKSPQDRTILVLIFSGRILGVFCLYIYIYMLLKVVSHYDLSVMSMSVMGLQTKFG